MLLESMPHAHLRGRLLDDMGSGELEMGARVSSVSRSGTRRPHEGVGESGGAADQVPSALQMYCTVQVYFVHHASVLHQYRCVVKKSCDAWLPSLSRRAGSLVSGIKFSARRTVPLYFCLLLYGGV